MDTVPTQQHGTVAAVIDTTAAAPTPITPPAPLGPIDPADTPFRLTPDQVLELQLSRLRATTTSRRLTEQELIDYVDDTPHDPEHERQVLATALAGVTGILFGGSSLMGWAMSRSRSSEEKKQGFFKMFSSLRPSKAMKELEAKKLADQSAQVAAEITRLSPPAVPGAPLVGEAVSATAAVPPTTPAAAAATLKTNPNSLTPAEQAKILVQEAPQTSQPAKAYAKFQRKGADVPVVEPASKAAYDYKQAKLARQAASGKRSGFTSVSQVPKRLRTSGFLRGFGALAIATVSMTGGCYLLFKSVSQYLGFKSHQEYTKFMQDEDAGYTPVAVAEFARASASGIQSWLLTSPLNSLMFMMKTELEKETPVTLGDMQILDQAQMAAAYFLGYQIDLYNGLMQRNSRATNLSYDEFVDTFTQPLPQTQEELEQEQLRLLKEMLAMQEQQRKNQKNNV